MSLIGPLLVLVVFLALAAAVLRPALLGERRQLEMEHHRAALQRIHDDATAHLISRADAQAMTLDVQRRMLRVPKAVAETHHAPLPVAATLIVLGVAVAAGALGYVTFGNAPVPDHQAAAPPVPPQVRASYAQAQATLLKDPADIPAWIDLSAAMVDAHRSADAVEALTVATNAMPGSADLWVALGQSLVAHGEGQLTPAARLAFDRASQIDPSHPGPKLYLALAWIQAGQPQQALPMLEQLARDSPPDAPWMPRVQRMTRGARAMIAAGVGQSSPPR